MGYNRAKILNSFFWKLFERSSVQGISFLVSILLARILAPSDYGTIALILVFINLANVIIDGGFNQALIQKKEISEIDFSSIFCVSFAFSVLIYMLLFIAAPTISAFYSMPQMTSIIRVLALSMPFYAINSIQRAILSREMQFKQLFKSSLIATITTGAIGIGMAYKGYGVWALVCSNMASVIIITFVMFFTVKWRPQFQFSKDSFSKLFGFGWKIFASNMLISLFVNTRSLIIGRLYTPQMLAFFDRGKQFPTIIMDNINASLQSVLFPAFSSEQDKREHVKVMVRRSIKTSSLIIFPLMLGLFVIAKPLIGLLLTDKWADAVPFLQIFCIAYLVMPMQIANMEAIKSMGYSDITLKLEIVKKIIEFSILVTSVFINVYAIALGTVFYNFICIFINLYPNRKLLNYGISEQLKDILPALSLSLVMFIFLYLIQGFFASNFTALFVEIVLGAIIYVTLCIIFKIESFKYLIDAIRQR